MSWKELCNIDQESKKVGNQKCRAHLRNVHGVRTPAIIQCQFFPPPLSLKDTGTFLLEKEELFQVQNKNKNKKKCTRNKAYTAQRKNTILAASPDTRSSTYDEVDISCSPPERHVVIKMLFSITEKERLLNYVKHQYEVTSSLVYLLMIL